MVTSTPPVYTKEISMLDQLHCQRFLSVDLLVNFVLPSSKWNDKHNNRKYKKFQRNGTKQKKGNSNENLKNEGKLNGKETNQMSMKQKNRRSRQNDDGVRRNGYDLHKSYEK